MLHKAAVLLLIGILAISFLPATGSSHAQASAEWVVKGTPNELGQIIVGQFGELHATLQMEMSEEEIFFTLYGHEEYTLIGKVINTCTGSGATTMCYTYQLNVRDILFWLYQNQDGVCLYSYMCSYWHLTVDKKEVYGPFLPPIIATEDYVEGLGICAATAIDFEFDKVYIAILGGRCNGGEVLMIRTPQFTLQAHLGFRLPLESWLLIESIVEKLIADAVEANNRWREVQ